VRLKQQRIIKLNQDVVGIIPDIIDKCAELGDLNLGFENYDDALSNYYLVEHCLEYLKTSKKDGSPVATLNNIEINDYLASIKNNIGICIYQQARTGSAIPYFEKAEEIRRENNDIDGRSRSLLYLSICYIEDDNKDDDKAMTCVNEIIKIRKKQHVFSGTLEEEKIILKRELQERQNQHDLQGVAGIKCDLGMICERMRNELETNSDNRPKIDELNKEAINYYSESLVTKSLPEACNAQILYRLAAIYKSKGKFTDARKYAEKSLKKGKLLYKGDIDVLDQLYVAAQHCTLIQYYPEGRGNVGAWIEHPKRMLADISKKEGKNDKLIDYTDRQP